MEDKQVHPDVKEIKREPTVEQFLMQKRLHVAEMEKIHRTKKFSDDLKARNEAQRIESKWDSELNVQRGQLSRLNDAIEFVAADRFYRDHSNQPTATWSGTHESAQQVYVEAVLAGGVAPIVDYLRRDSDSLWKEWDASYGGGKWETLSEDERAGAKLEQKHIELFHDNLISEVEDFKPMK